MHKKDELKNILNRIAPIQVGRHGQIMEWNEDYDEVEDILGVHENPICYIRFSNTNGIQKNIAEIKRYVSEISAASRFVFVVV